MFLQSLIQLAHLCVDELVHAFHAALMGDRQWVACDPDYFVMEQRIALSASPLDAGFAETVAPLTSDDAQAIYQQVEQENRESDRPHEIVFIDSGTRDLDTLRTDILQQHPSFSPSSVFVLDSQRDGVEQIGEFLETAENVRGVHVISHGVSNRLKLGNSWLSSDNVSSYREALASWTRSLAADADLLFYGCNVARDPEGQAMLGQIASFTGADVAASSDVSGSSQLGADWLLEFQRGPIETHSLFDHTSPSQWTGLLGTLAVTNTNDLSNGDTSSITALLSNDGGDGISLREAIEAANRTENQGGPDRISFAIPGEADTHVIRPHAGQGLPRIVDPVIIDATTQSGEPSATPRIVLDGGGKVRYGIDLGHNASGSTIRGFSMVGFRNGIRIANADDILILDNFIGMDPSETPETSIGNAANGILLQRTSGNRIDGNVIVHNRNAGITLNAGARENVITNNRIGVDHQGNARGNLRRGIGISGLHTQFNIIGRPYAGNIIAHSEFGDGVFLWNATTGNSIRGNSIYENAGLGINLWGGIQDPFGVTRNDTLNGLVDTDLGPNHLQNFPTLRNASSDGSSTVVAFEFLAGRAPQRFVVDFYSSPTADPSRHGEGATYLGSYVTEHVTGLHQATIVLPHGTEAGHFLTATATLLTNADSPADTSEFSLALPIDGNTQPPIGSGPDDETRLQLLPVVSQVPENLNLTLPFPVADVVFVGGQLGEHHVSIAGPDAAMFEIIDSQLVLRAGHSLDSETNPVLDVSLHVDGASSAANSGVPFSLTVRESKEAPSVRLVGLVPPVLELSPWNSTDVRVAEIVIMDDSLGQTKITLAGADADRFFISDGTLWLRWDAQSMIFPQSSLQVSVQVRDGTTTSVVASRTYQLVIQESISALPVPPFSTDPSNENSPSDDPGNSDEENAPVDDEPTLEEPVEFVQVAERELQVAANAAGPPPRHLKFRRDAGSGSLQAPIGLTESALLAIPESTFSAQEPLATAVARTLTRTTHRHLPTHRPASELRVTAEELSLSPYQGLFREASPLPLRTQDFVVGTTALVSSTLSVGYAVWILRGGTLVASVLSTVPSWMFFDPLPILDRFEQQPFREHEEAATHFMDTLPTARSPHTTASTNS